MSENKPNSQDADLQTKVVKQIKNMTWVQALTILLIIGLAVVATCYAVKYYDAKDEVAKLSNPQVSAQEEARRITEAVGELVAIPDETPTLATVTDVSKLKKQAFFANAENGDKVLIFTTAKQAILYRPSTNKVIQIAPINTKTNTPNTSNTGLSGSGGSSSNQ